MPYRFSAEVYLEQKGKEYRSVTQWSYKIIYRINEPAKEVRIVEIIHTGRDTTAIGKLE